MSSSSLQPRQASGRRDQLLANVIVDAIAADGAALQRLRELLRVAEAPAPAPPAYTVTTLAAALGVSDRVIRNAIARRDLAAVKRGGRWYITCEAVDAWLSERDAPRFVRAARRGPRRRPLQDALSPLAASSPAA